MKKRGAFSNRSHSLGAGDRRDKRSNSYQAAGNSFMQANPSPQNNYYARGGPGGQIGASSDFNNGTGAVKKQMAPGNYSQQNSNPFGVTDRGFAPNKAKKMTVHSSMQGKPPMGNMARMHGYNQGGPGEYRSQIGGLPPVNKSTLLPPLPQGKLPAASAAMGNNSLAMLGQQSKMNRNIKRNSQS